MITKFKLYEAVNFDDPEIGDYVIANTCDGDNNASIIINNNIGVISDIEYNKAYNYEQPFCVEYTGFDFGENTDYWWFDEKDLVYWSKNKEELELLLQTNKYNL